MCTATWATIACNVLTPPGLLLFAFHSKLSWHIVLILLTIHVLLLEIIVLGLYVAWSLPGTTAHQRRFGLLDNFHGVNQGDVSALVHEET